MNDEPTCDYLNPKVSIDNGNYCRIICQIDSYEKIAGISRDDNYEYHKYFLGTCKIFFINCYNIVSPIIIIHTFTNIFLFLFFSYKREFTEREK